MSEIMNAYSIKLINSLLLAIVFLGGFLIGKFFLYRKVKNKKLRSQYAIRIQYLFFIFFMFFFIKIWVDGFTEIFAFIGFLSAAITLTQKDNLMNIVGWLIINWRGLFTEEDYIKISNYGGYVKSMGILYFTLVEASIEFPESKTGSIIKVPNGWVAKNPIINYSHDKFVESSLNFVFKPTSNFDAIEDLFLVLKNEMSVYLKNQSEMLAPKYYVKIRQEKPAGYEMVFQFYSKLIDKAQLQYKINKCVVDFTASHKELTIAFD